MVEEVWKTKIHGLATKRPRCTQGGRRPNVLFDWWPSKVTCKSRFLCRRLSFGGDQTLSSNLTASGVDGIGCIYEVNRSIGYILVAALSIDGDETHHTSLRANNIFGYNRGNHWWRWPPSQWIPATVDPFKKPERKRHCMRWRSTHDCSGEIGGFGHSTLVKVKVTSVLSLLYFGFIKPKIG